MDGMRDNYKRGHSAQETHGQPPAAPQHHESPAPPAPEPANKPKRSRKKPVILWLVTLLILVGLGAGGWWFTHHSVSPVPKNIQKAVSFPVFYADQKKLPAGYQLDLSSFSSGSGVAEFIVKNGQQKLVFTEQVEPPAQEVQSFASSRLPLNYSVSTPVGTAVVGAIGSNTFISLPTHNNVWILISGPEDINQNQLKQVLNSLKD